jgi:hypothetical protein
MNKKNSYLFLSGLFFVVYLVLQFTDIYGDSGWIKAFVVILFTTFLWSGIATKVNKKIGSDEKEK